MRRPGVHACMAYFESPPPAAVTCGLVVGLYCAMAFRVRDQGRGALNGTLADWRREYEGTESRRELRDGEHGGCCRNARSRDRLAVVGGSELRERRMPGASGLQQGSRCVLAPTCRDQVAIPAPGDQERPRHGLSAQVDWR